MLAPALVALLAVSAVEFPAAPQGRVNDFARVMSGSARQRLEGFLADAEVRTSNQIVVVTLPSLDGEDIADVGYRIGQTWKVGQAGRDNGVVLVLAIEDRRMRIEVGKGLEGALTDLESKIILDEVIRPALAQGRYDEGITRGAQAIVQAVEGEFQGQGAARTSTRQRGSPLGGLVILGIFALLFFISPRTGMLVLGGLMMGGRRGGGGGGGGFSGGGGSFGGGGASGNW